VRHSNCYASYMLSSGVNVGLVGQPCLGYGSVAGQVMADPMLCGTVLYSTIKKTTDVGIGGKDTQ
jgi:hypothetical protein